VTEETSKLLFQPVRVKDMIVLSGDVVDLTDEAAREIVEQTGAVVVVVAGDVICETFDFEELQRAGLFHCPDPIDPEVVGALYSDALISALGGISWSDLPRRTQQDVSMAMASVLRQLGLPVKEAPDA
jgi:hypothetical protein